MARANIYIQKHNEEAWEKSDKSKWINALLQKGDKVVTDKDKIKVADFCEHGFAPGFCKKGCKK